MPLSQDGLAVEIESGTQIVPHDGDTPLPLSEDNDTGLVRFVMIVATKDMIDRIAQTLSIGLAIAPDQLRDVIDVVMHEHASFVVHRADAMII